MLRPVEGGEFIDTHREQFGVEPICAVLECAPSTYWAAKKRELAPSARAVRDEWLKKEIVRVWEGPGRRVYGARKVWTHLNREGVEVARCTVERLMRELGIAGACAARKRPRTTVAGADRPGDLLERDFTADAPNRRWVADITYVDTAGGWVYAAFVQDLFSRSIVGWQVTDHLGAELALDALEMATGRVATSTAAWSITATGACNIRRSGTPNGWIRSARPVQ